MRTVLDIGPAEMSVMTAAARFVVVGRASVVLACTALLPIHAPVASSVVIVVAVLAWQAAFMIATDGGRRPRPWGVTAAVDGVTLAAVCVWLPYAPVPHGYVDLDDWAFPVTSVVVVTAQWYTRPRGGALIALLTAAGVVAGSALATGADRDLGTAHAVLLLCQGGLSRGLVVLVARGARRVDELTDAVAAGQRTTQLAAARRADIEVHMAQLHDTVAATLTAAASPGASGPELIRRARADLSRLTPELRLAADGHDAFAVLTTPQVTDALMVTTKLLGPDPGPGRWAEALRTVPADAVFALAAARDEALRNVERHAGTGRARVELRLASVGVELDVVDDGRGFEPEDVGGPHFGLRLSIEARMRRVGGGAVVVSAPGCGTRVQLRWPAAPASAGDGRLADSHQER